MHYAIGDVHGCFDELMLLIRKILKKDKDAKFILIGDLIERGPKTLKMIDWALENITKDGMFQCVRGNHEQMAYEWYIDEFMPWWQRKEHFGVTDEPMPQTYYDFSKLVEENNLATPDKLKPFMSFIESLPYDKKLTVTTAGGVKATYRLVHAWYDYSPNIPEEVQHRANLWKRCGFGSYASDEIIIHGHTPTINITYISANPEPDRPGLIGYRHNAINVDGGCCFGTFVPYPAMLCALCLENLQEIYPYTISKCLYKQAEGILTKEEAAERARQYQKEYLSTENAYYFNLIQRLNLNPRLGRIVV